MKTFLLILLCVFLFPKTAYSTENLSLNLSVDTSAIMDLFDVQDASLDELERQYDLMKSQINTLDIQNKELQLKLSESRKLIDDLKTSLNAVEQANKEQLEYSTSLEEKLNKSESRYKSASIAGPLAGILFTVGGALIIYGAVEKNNPVWITGTALSGTTLILWTTGKVVFKWW